MSRPVISPPKLASRPPILEQHKVLYSAPKNIAKTTTVALDPVNQRTNSRTHKVLKNQLQESKAIEGLLLGAEDVPIPR